MEINLENSHIKIIDTKTKILAVANELFASQGFDGVSVRDIANAAEVNVASINYHFKNKLNLFHEIFIYNHAFLTTKIEEASQKSGINTEEMALEVFNIFNENATAIINGFKMILSEHLQKMNEELSIPNQEPLGPPGEKAILKIITQDVGEDVSLKNREWVSRMLFKNIIHTAIIMNTHYLRQKCAQEYWMKPQQKEKDIKMLAKALIQHISHPA